MLIEYMHTSIVTQHDYNVIEHFLQLQQPDLCKQENTSINALDTCHQIIMTHNIFKLGLSFRV